MIIASVVVTVGLMTFFSVFYNHFYVKNENRSKNINRKFLIDYCGFHVIYIINILTNKGTVLSALLLNFILI